jgi:hypothetical protein
MFNTSLAVDEWDLPLRLFRIGTGPPAGQLFLKA